MNSTPPLLRRGSSWRTWIVRGLVGGALWLILLWMLPAQSLWQAWVPWNSQVLSTDSEQQRVLTASDQADRMFVSLNVHDLKTGRFLHILAKAASRPGDSGPVRGALSADGQFWAGVRQIEPVGKYREEELILARLSDGEILWRKRSNELTQGLPALRHSGAIVFSGFGYTSIQFNQEGRRVAIRFWDHANNRNVTAVLDANSGEMLFQHAVTDWDFNSSYYFSLDGTKLILHDRVPTDENGLQSQKEVWRRLKIGSDRPDAVYVPRYRSVRNVQVLESAGLVIGTSEGDGQGNNVFTTQVFDLATGQVLHEFPGESHISCDSQGYAMLLSKAPDSLGQVVVRAPSSGRELGRKDFGPRTHPDAVFATTRADDPFLALSTRPSEFADWPVRWFRSQGQLDLASITTGSRRLSTVGWQGTLSPDGRYFGTVACPWWRDVISRFRRRFGQTWTQRSDDLYLLRIYEVPSAWPVWAATKWTLLLSAGAFAVHWLMSQTVTFCRQCWRWWCR